MRGQSVVCDRPEAGQALAWVRAHPAWIDDPEPRVPGFKAQLNLRRPRAHGGARARRAAAAHALQRIKVATRGPGDDLFEGRVANDVCAGHWGSRKNTAAKALRKLAGPHLPASLSRLERAIKRAHAAHENAEQAGRRQRDADYEHATRATAPATDSAATVEEEEREDEAA